MRKCGTCSACCRWPSIDEGEFHKPARVPCQHLHKQGYRCTIYADRPKMCSEYRCTWLRGMGSAVDNRDRPNSCGVLIDRRSTQFGVVLVAKSLTPNAAMSPKGKRAIERTTRDEDMPCLVIDDDERVIGAAGPDDFMKEVESKIWSGQGHLGGQKDWLVNIVAAAQEGRVYPGLNHGG